MVDLLHLCRSVGGSKMNELVGFLLRRVGASLLQYEVMNELNELRTVNVAGC